MKPINKVIERLNQILSARVPDRELVFSFQNEIWHNEVIKDEALKEILSELALDYYEPNEEWRKENRSFYGEEKLSEIIDVAVQRIMNYSRSTEGKI
jgi:hypothetical protein